MSFFSPDGKCFSFDHHANCYVKGEGASFFVVKLLADALRDGDMIRAVIRATGANQDWKTGRPQVSPSQVRKHKSRISEKLRVKVV